MILQPSELRRLRRENEDLRIALRLGCYDILHPGHQHGIDFAGSQADLLVVGVMPDAYVRKHKGYDRPVNDALSRAAAIDAADGVDFSFVAPEGRFAIASLMLRMKPDVYVEDAEYGHSSLKAAFLGAIGTRYVIDPSEHLGSSSRMIALLGVEEARARSSMSFAWAESDLAS